MTPVQQEPADLTAWLRQQLDEVELLLRSLDSTALNGIESTAGYEVREYVERGLAEVDAKRRILDLHSAGDAYFALPAHCERCVDTEAGGPDPDAVYPCLTVRLLAVPFADRPGYRPEWRSS